MIERIRGHDHWRFFGILLQADRTLAVAWWAVLVLRGVLPALMAITIGMLVGAVERGDDLVAPLVLAGGVFLPLQVLSPIHHALSANLGSRTAAWLYDRLTSACVGPPGMGHLEDPKLTSDLTMARDFDLGISGPPLAFAVDFIASGLVEMVAGLTSAAVLAGYAWWAPLLLAGGWLATHWLCARAASGATEIRKKSAPRSATPTMPTAWRSNHPPPRSSGCSGWGAGPWSDSDRGAAVSPSCDGRPLACASVPSSGAW